MVVLKIVVIASLTAMYYLLRTHQRDIEKQNPDMPQWARDVTRWLLTLLGFVFLLIDAFVIFS